MKSSRVIVSAILGVVILLVIYLFTFKVRKNEVAVHYRPPGKVLRKVNLEGDDAGLHLRLPWPFDTVNKYDMSVQVLDGKTTQIQLQDDYQVVISMYAAWQIDEPATFVESLSGDMEKARVALKDVIDNETSKRLGKATFSDLISADPQKNKYDQVQSEIRDNVRRAVQERNYGLKIVSFGVRQIAVPESVTKSMFTRMNAERQAVAKTYISEGQKEQDIIKSAARREASETISKAQGEAQAIMSKAEQEEADVFPEFAKAPELAILLEKLEALRTIAGQARDSGTILTFIIDTVTPPFDLLDGGPTAGTAIAAPPSEAVDTGIGALSRMLDDGQERED